MFNQIGVRGHYLYARWPLGAKENKIGQCILVCNDDRKYDIRVLLEPCEIFQDIHALKLARELVDAFTYNKELTSWDNFKDRDVVFHVVFRANRGYLFVSDREYDYQFGIVEDVEGFSSETLSYLICHMLNGQGIEEFSIKYGDVVIE